MRLYHGTSESRLQTIFKEGIKPRGKKKGNWKHTVESNASCVYLSAGYAIYFAGNSVKGKEERLAIIEVDTSRLQMLDIFPDEDFLEQTSRKEGPAPTNKSMEYRTRWYRRRLPEFQSYWTLSVEHMGTCCYGGTVPVSAMTRVATLGHKTYMELIWCGMDPTITPMNWMICQAKYRNFIKWLFGDELEPDPMAVRPEGDDRPQFYDVISRADVQVYTINEFITKGKTDE